MLFIFLLQLKAVVGSEWLQLTVVSEDALCLFLCSGRDECAHKVVGKRDQENHKEQNLGLKERQN